MAAAEILSPEGRTILEDAKIWTELPLDFTWPCPAVATAWDGPDLVWTTFGGTSGACAWHLDRIRFDAWMIQRMQARGVVVSPGTVEEARDHEGTWRVIVNDDRRRTVSSRCLALATGRGASPLRLPIRHHIDNLCLVSGMANPDPVDPDTLIVEATSDGWWYSAPLTNGTLFTGWMTDFSLLGRKRHDEAATASLTHAPVHAGRVGAMRITGVIGSATWSLAPAAGPGWIAIGDAALARDPISGDGLVSALQSARDGAEVVTRALNGDRDAWRGAAERAEVVARRYEARRRDLYRTAQARWPSSPFWTRFSSIG